mmetsp:Transcript_19938/g.47086  ORF Transcript_19938/g.47086 Transcript_19938/m.47086 type:complete len:204 (-) Transcript_19938:877-1488(-)
MSERVGGGINCQHTLHQLHAGNGSVLTHKLAEIVLGNDPIQNDLVNSTLPRCQFQQIDIKWVLCGSGDLEANQLAVLESSAGVDGWHEWIFGFQVFVSPFSGLFEKIRQVAIHLPTIQLGKLHLEHWHFNIDRPRIKHPAAAKLSVSKLLPNLAEPTSVNILESCHIPMYLLLKRRDEEVCSFLTDTFNRKSGEVLLRHDLEE